MPSMELLPLMSVSNKTTPRGGTLLQVPQEGAPCLPMPGAYGQGTGRHAQQTEMMVARLHFGRAGGASYILLPS
jgi:hypothetical protein